MTRVLLLIAFSLLSVGLHAQSSVRGVLQDNNSEVLPFAHVGLYSTADSSLVKVETTNDKGEFTFINIAQGAYLFKATFLGLPDLYINPVEVNQADLDLGTLKFSSEGAQDLNEFTVTAERTLVEVHPDRTVFNVQGTINSTGGNAISLLRKAPSVTVDNQDNVSVMGRTGVRVYVDGKQLPLEGDDLSNYLNNLPADQIDRIEVITSPGAKYDAEGNAGIIDIRLKKDQNVGANGSLAGTFTQGQLTRYNLNASGNYRNKKLNVFGGAGYNVNDNFHNMIFQSYQNGLFLDEINNTQNNRDIYNYRLGTDFFLNKYHTIGFLVGGNTQDGEEVSFNQIEIAPQSDVTSIDSVLVADNEGVSERSQNTFNLNYRFYGEQKQSLNIDLDYGQYRNTNQRFQPNRYYESVAQETLFSESNYSFDTPVDIDIYTAKLDYEANLGKGKFGAGAKYSQVLTNNVFQVYDVIGETTTLDSTRSNSFEYDEQVNAGYLSYTTPLSKKVSVSAGLRTEQTISTGILSVFIDSLSEDAVDQNYWSWFPSAGVTWQVKPMQSLALNYSRRINRPDYNILNPFRNQLSEFSFERGNPFLRPEIVNNIELGYTLFYKFNFKLGYSRTVDQITRLIGPDDSDPRAGFISWDNLAEQTVWSFNASLPMEIKKWWNMYANISLSHVDNQADYGDGAVVDVQVFSYSFFQSSTFTLPRGYRAELSGYYSGPGVWGGVFRYEANWSVDVGIQKMFLDDALKVRLSGSNIFNRVGWLGESNFNGLRSVGNGRWDNHAISLSVNYNFGNQNIKSRKRKTGIEAESGRVK